MADPSIIPLFLTSGQNVSTQTNEVLVNLPFPLVLQDYYVALSTGYFYLSNPNISATYYNNASFSYTWVDGTVVPVTMPDGNYQFSDINGFLQLVMTQNNHYLVNSTGQNVYYLAIQLNITYYAVTFTCLPVPSSLPAGWTKPGTWSLPGSPVTPQFTFPTSNINTLFGLPAGTYPPTPISTEYQTNSTSAPEISPVTNFNIACNLVSASAWNQNATCLYTVAPTVSYGVIQEVEPVKMTWLKVADGSYSQISIRMLTQDNAPLYMLDPNMSWYLYLAKRSAIRF